MRRLAAAVALCSALAACSSSSPAADLQSKMNDIVTAANNKDAAGLRTAVGVFLQEVDAESQNGDITSTKAQDLRTVAARVLNDASALEGGSPAPSPSSAAPPPTQAYSPPPSPSPRYSPPPQPSPTAAPPSPDVVPSVGISSGSSPQSSPSP